MSETEILNQMPGGDEEPQTPPAEPTTPPEEPTTPPEEPTNPEPGDDEVGGGTDDPSDEGKE